MKRQAADACQRVKTARAYRHNAVSKKSESRTGDLTGHCAGTGFGGCLQGMLFQFERGDR
jgi:hypothetical protein